MPGFTYDDLDAVADGNDASPAFYRLTSDPPILTEDRSRHRRALRTYCRRDTLAMLYMHRQLTLSVVRRSIRSFADRTS